MDALKLLKKYKLSADEINKWFTKKLLESVEKDQVPDEFKDYVVSKGIENEQLCVFIDVNPRSIYDLLDEHGIIIQILYNEKDKFSFAIDDYIESGSESRKDAEFDALKEGMKLLEEKLKSQQK